MVSSPCKWEVNLCFMFDPVLPIFWSSAVLFVCLLRDEIRKPDRVPAPFLLLSILTHLYVWVPIPVLVIYFYPPQNEIISPKKCQRSFIKGRGFKEVKYVCASSIGSRPDLGPESYPSEWNRQEALGYSIQEPKQMNCMLPTSVLWGKW